MPCVCSSLPVLHLLTTAMTDGLHHGAVTNRNRALRAKPKPATKTPSSTWSPDRQLRRPESNKKKHRAHKDRPAGQGDLRNALFKHQLRTGSLAQQLTIDGVSEDAAPRDLAEG